MLCAAESDPFQGDNYRIAAVIHESILCPILNKMTVFIFSTPKSIQYNCNTKTHNIMQQNKKSNHEQHYTKLTTSELHLHQQPAINEITTTATYFPDERSTSNLIHRKTNSSEYHQHHQQHSHQHHHSPQHHYQQKSLHNQEKPLEIESVLKDDYILEPDDMDMEVIEPATTATTATITAEYTMPTTKID